MCWTMWLPTDSPGCRGFVTGVFGMRPLILVMLLATGAGAGEQGRQHMRHAIRASVSAMVLCLQGGCAEEEGRGSTLPHKRALEVVAGGEESCAGVLKKQRILQDKTEQDAYGLGKPPPSKHRDEIESMHEVGLCTLAAAI